MTESERSKPKAALIGWGIYLGLLAVVAAVAVLLAGGEDEQCMQDALCSGLLYLAVIAVAIVGTLGASLVAMLLGRRARRKTPSSIAARLLVWTSTSVLLLSALAVIAAVVMMAVSMLRAG